METQWRLGENTRKIEIIGQSNRKSSLSAAILDSQSVKSATMVSQEVEYDTGKKTKGRKRHLLVDTLGLLIGVIVTSAN